jgi:hypothetical protein
MAKEEEPYTAMKFGSELEFNNAILELKWLKSLKGSISEEDFEAIALKYQFPTEFLKTGLTGLKYPDDYKISKNKWFPILYAWHKHREDISYEIEKAAAYVGRYGQDFRNFAVLGISVLVYLFIYYYSLFLPALGIFISVEIFLFGRVKTAKLELDDAIHNAKRKGYPNIADDLLELLKKKPLLVYYGFLSKKKIKMELYELGVTKTEKGEIIPVFDGEEWEEEYEKRIYELIKK